MLGITKISSGRMGNHLFHYHFLRQIAAQTGIDYFHREFPEKKYFADLGRKSRPFSLFRKQLKLNSQKIVALKPEELLEIVREKNKTGHDIIFQPPILGEVFFDYLFFPPENFLKIKPGYQKPFGFEIGNKLIIGLHFRGTDFAVWNIQASLKFPYYQKAIRYCLTNFPERQLTFVLFTDDLKFPAYLETIKYLGDSKLEFHLSANLNSPIVDFYQLSHCDVIISSPSTFAVLAGAIGKPKKIIHNQEWLDYALANNDLFWKKLTQTRNPYYSLWHSL